MGTAAVAVAVAASRFTCRPRCLPPSVSPSSAARAHEASQALMATQAFSLLCLHQVPRLSLPRRSPYHHFCCHRHPPSLQRVLWLLALNGACMRSRTSLRLQAPFTTMAPSFNTVGISHATTPAMAVVAAVACIAAPATLACAVTATTHTRPTVMPPTRTHPIHTIRPPRCHPRHRLRVSHLRHLRRRPPRRRRTLRHLLPRLRHRYATASRRSAFAS